MTKPLAPGFLLLFVASLVGCQSAEKRTYDLIVRNATEAPIVVWLTKDGPPFEKDWLSPEDIAIESPKSPDRLGGVAVDPGKTAVSGARTGRFAKSTLAVLRIYDSPTSISDILSTSRNSSRRVDVYLDPGRTRLVVRREGDRVVALRDGH